MRLSAFRALLLLTLVAFLLAGVVGAQEATAVNEAVVDGEEIATQRGAQNVADSDEAENDDEDDMDEPLEDELETDEEVLPDVEGGQLPSVWGSTIFPGYGGSPFSPALPAGSRANCVIAFQNNDPEHSDVILLAVAYLQPLKVYDTVLQNFSVVRHARSVRPGETVSVSYSFTPYELLEPGDYNLVVGLYFRDNTTNTTAFVATFNSTVAITEAVGTDPRTILTYLTLLLILVGVGYFVVRRFGLSKYLASMRAAKTTQTKRQQQVEMGTKGESYDPDYVSAEHRRFREALLAQQSASSSTRKSSSSPRKRQ